MHSFGFAKKKATSAVKQREQDKRICDEKFILILNKRISAKLDFKICNILLYFRGNKQKNPITPHEKIGLKALLIF